MKPFIYIGFLMSVLWSLLLLLGTVNGFTRDTEKNLRERVLNGYSAEVRPKSVTEVSMLFHVTSLSVVDIRNELFSVSGWWSMHWLDDRLQWADYQNIHVMQFKEEKIWTPVIVVSNSVDNLAAIAEKTIPVRVDRNGSVNWNPPGLIHVSCTMDVTYFPFDKQTCGVEITSFGYTVQEMDVKLYGDGLSFRYFSANGEWDIVKTYSERDQFEEDGYPYARVTFYFQISRKPLFYGLNMLLPVIVCAALILFVFLLPAESGEKIGYCLTVLLAFMVILTLVADDLPTTAASTSILQVYIAVVLAMGGLSVVLSIIALHLFFLPEDKPVGPKTRAMTRLFQKLCCHDGCCTSSRRVEPGGSFKQPNGREDYTFYDGKQSYYRGEISGQPVYQNTPTNIQNMPNAMYLPGTDTSGYNNTRPRLIKEHTFEKFRPDSAGHKKAQQDNSNDDVTITWQDVSRALDAIMFRIYAIFLVVSAVVFVTILVTGDA